MNILNAQQIRSADRYTIINEPIASIDLMERAAGKCLQWIQNQESIDENTIIHLFCGLGNNGGDGLALARMLSLSYYQIRVYIVHYADTMSDEFIINYNRIEEIEIHPHSIHSSDDFPVIEEEHLVIDAIFGIGLNKPPKGWVKKLLQHINNSNADILAIDVPSGLPIDNKVEDKEAVIQATTVLSFQLPKLAFLLPDNATYVPHFDLLDIGLHQDYIENFDTDYQIMFRDDLIDYYRKRNKFSHKGDFGHTLIIGGSFGKMGSVVLASRAALKIGSGLVTAYIPKCGYQVLQNAVTEAMVEVDQENILQFFNPKTQADVFGVGIGMGTDPETQKGFLEWLQNNQKPVVLDADALNIIAQHPEYIEKLNANTILTPHPKELERLIGKWDNDYEKLERLKKLTTKYPFVLVLKGAHTATCYKGKIYFNTTGNAGLAKAGSGDVLTGIIAGLLAQKYTPFEAAVLGVSLHGLAADVYVTLNSPETLLATDIINFLPGAFNTFLNPYDKLDNFDDNNNDETNFLDDDDL